MPAPMNGVRSVAVQTVQILGRTSVILTRSAQASDILLGRFSVGGQLITRRGFGRRNASTNVMRQLGTNRAVTLVDSTKAPNVDSPNFCLTHRTTGTNVAIRALPKPATYVPTVISSKLPYSEFYFRKFVPRGGNERACLRSLGSRIHAVVFCRSPCEMIGALRRFTRIFKRSERIDYYHRVSGLRRRDIHKDLTRMVTRFRRARPHNRFIVILTNGSPGLLGRRLGRGQHRRHGGGGWEGCWSWGWRGKRKL